MRKLVRYAKIDTVLPREFLLLQGRGCVWKQCAFCDYHQDVSENPYEVNRPVLEQVTGEYGVLDIINSGSAPELDEETLALIRKVADACKVHTLWFEAHWLYREKLMEFGARFPNQRVKFRCGVETFDPILRESWKKGIPPEVCAKDLAQYFQGVCLLAAVEGQTREGILRDINLARQYFEYFSLNAFVENSTNLCRDEKLAAWLSEEIAPMLREVPGAELLLSNVDLGVG